MKTSCGVALTLLAVVTAQDKSNVGSRLGLINQNPLGTSNSGQSQNFVSKPSSQAGGRTNQQCCCVPTTQSCNQDDGGFGGPDLVGGGFIDPRINRTLLQGIGTRIVNNPSNRPAPQTSCPTNFRTCCYDDNVDVGGFQRTCVTPQQANQQAQGIWQQGCAERITTGGIKQCGTRSYRPVSGLEFGQSSPGEFPWTCLLLNQNNDFIGSCVIVPQDFSNNNGRGTRKVLTAAHKLAKIGQSDLLKVRVGEWDASGFNAPEQQEHKEYTVVRITKHPQFSAKRLNNNIAMLTVNQDIDLSQSNINTACLPSCDNQFDFRFNNGTGTRCWVAGWGKDQENGQFQFIQRKVDLPLVEFNRCSQALKAAMNKRNPGLGNRFTLHNSEVCAGGELGKDACTGDGGSPLVCQAQSGRYTVVGLVTWGVGCASDVPGVYAKISYFRDWINQN